MIEHSSFQIIFVEVATIAMVFAGGLGMVWRTWIKPAQEHAKDVDLNIQNLKNKIAAIEARMTTHEEFCVRSSDRKDNKLHKIEERLRCQALVITRIEEALKK